MSTWLNGSFDSEYQALPLLPMWSLWMRIISQHAILKKQLLSSDKVSQQLGKLCKSMTHRPNSIQHAQSF